ncbi:MAG: hypothetical protein HY457_00410 [Parcubacteria group bacterium]|nr:hypothetical protein [Parcubacteria group bacterium]
MQGTCELCAHPVGSGGNRHAKGHCPPMRGKNPVDGGPNRHARKRMARAKAKPPTMDVARGAPVAGIHKVAASSSKSRTTKKTEQKKGAK